MKFDTLVHKVANQKGWTLLYIKEDDVYRLQLATTGDRRQDVFITFRQDDAQVWVATIWSVVADVDDFNLSDPLELLRFNWRHVWGHLALREREVVLVHNQITSETDWIELARVVDAIAHASDGIEAMIYGDQDTN
ncbi:MAG: YbjN domain-containing protein [Planctomycetes bacterium]|nr:YbjN domain-containing protein [Planctomycetota bacterium]